MIRKSWPVFFCGLTALGLTFSPAQPQKEKAPPPKPKAAPAEKIDEGICFGCHSEIEILKGKRKHAKNTTRPTSPGNGGRLRTATGSTTPQPPGSLWPSPGTPSKRGSRS